MEMETNVVAASAWLDILIVNLSCKILQLFEIMIDCNLDRLCHRRKSYNGLNFSRCCNSVNVELNFELDAGQYSVYRPCMGFAVIITSVYLYTLFW